MRVFNYHLYFNYSMTTQHLIILILLPNLQFLISSTLIHFLTPFPVKAIHHLPLRYHVNHSYFHLYPSFDLSKLKQKEINFTKL